MQLRQMMISTALAAASLTGSNAEAAEAPKWYETTKVSGFVDAYYKFNPNGIKSATASTATTTFDKHQNQASLAGGKLSLGAMDGMAVVDLYFGDYAAALQPTVVPESAAVGQAYIAQAFGPVTMTLGRYMTHVGFEVADSVANWNYTRALLYGAVPFFHQGVKLAYSPMEGLGLMVQMDNGSGKNYTTGNETAGGAQVSYTGITGLATYFNYYYEPTFTGVVFEKNHYFDIVASYALMEGLTLAGEYLYTTSIAASDTDTNGDAIGTTYPTPDPATGKLVPYSPKKQGYALYIDYVTPMEGLSVTPRFEALYSPDAMMSTFDYTLTGRYVKGAVINWLELRVDAGDDAVYPAPVNDPGNMAYYETSLVYGVGYKF